MEDETKNVNSDTENGEVEETIETPEESLTDSTDSESTEEVELDIDQLQATNKKLYERAKRAEAEAKALKSRFSKPAEKQASLNSVDIEETVLLVNGMPEDLVKELKLIAQVRKTNLVKAQNDPLFVAYKEKYEKDKKQKESSLGASRNTGNTKVRKDFNTPGLSREEHMKMIQDSL